ncbi:MAG: hypothetical protein K2M01_03215 [Paramuribaculum sp.]|nr:hypothetical protein [Paramuribaculum sp.]
MNYKIKHRRLHAFFYSKVLNSLMFIIALSLIMASYNYMFVLSVVCALVALLLFIGYSLWLWIGKPDSVVINHRLSDLSGLYMLYCLLIITLKANNQLWYIIPLCCAIILMFLLQLRPSDQTFVIKS